ncbi:unnamed protein product [Linum trigynum]|uniref:Uncharacterized protein n=1 Tax=Linum trigynum TaxID=586398 RepID=A0AAV2ER74_9ROSI
MERRTTTDGDDDQRGRRATTALVDGDSDGEDGGAGRSHGGRRRYSLAWRTTMSWLLVSLSRGWLVVSPFPELSNEINGLCRVMGFGLKPDKLALIFQPWASPKGWEASLPAQNRHLGVLPLASAFCTPSSIAQPNTPRFLHAQQLIAPRRAPRRVLLNTAIARKFAI